MVIPLSWTEFKVQVANKNRVRYFDRESYYYITYTDEIGTFETSVLKDDGSEQTDFESNYKNTANKSIVPQKDSDGAVLQRVKVTTTGWSYQLHGLEIDTSTIDGTYSNKADGTPYGFSALKFYKTVDGADVQITGDDLNQTFLDSNCTKTVLDWEPNHDYELMGGQFFQKSRPTDDVELWVVGVPDVPAAYGGSKEFISQLDLAYIDVGQGIKIDGRAPKYLTYNATYHTNKMRFIFRHPAGYKHEMHIVFEIFKA